MRFAHQESTDAPAPTDDDSLAQLRRALQRPSTNILISGTHLSTAVRIVTELCVRPIYVLASDQVPVGPGTLLIPNLAALTPLRQRILSEWIENRPTAMRVIALTRQPIFAQVLAHRFDETLFYRLNVVTIELTVEESRPAIAEAS